MPEEQGPRASCAASARGRLPYRSPFLWSFLAGVVMLTAMRPLLRRVPEPPPVTGHLPVVALVDQEGRQFGPDDLRGHVHIAAPFSAACAPPCPDVMAGMRQLQDAYRERGIDEIQLLSISTESGPLDAGRMAVLGSEVGADPSRWRLLSGTREEMSQVWAALAPPADGALRPFVIIDGEGRLRGRYSYDGLGLDEVYNRAQHVLQESGRLSESGPGRSR